ncbi:MAG: hypothetical protein V3V00_15125 [Saprospiraceae bacterium]
MKRVKAFKLIAKGNALGRIAQVQRPLLRIECCDLAAFLTKNDDKPFWLHKILSAYFSEKPGVDN